jgi:hypothetical protein
MKAIHQLLYIEPKSMNSSRKYLSSNPTILRKHKFKFHKLTKALKVLILIKNCPLSKMLRNQNRRIQTHHSLTILKKKRFSMSKLLHTRNLNQVLWIRLKVRKNKSQGTNFLKKNSIKKLNSKQIQK